MFGFFFLPDLRGICIETGTPISSDFIMFPICLCGGSNCPLDASRVIQEESLSVKPA